MIRFLTAFTLFIGSVSISNGDEFKSLGPHGFSFSEINGWLGIGEDTKTFPQADLVFYAADRKNGKVNIRYPYTKLYMYANVTTGTPEEFFYQIEKIYKKGSPNLKFKRSKEINISAKVIAKVIYVLNVGPNNRAHAIASIPRKIAFASLVMEASTEELLMQNLPDFEDLLKTYKDLSE